jgi:hypothetical protein
MMMFFIYKIDILYLRWTLTEIMHNLPEKPSIELNKCCEVISLCVSKVLIF